MNFRRMPDEEPEINLISLIDVLLMALIFLIVTTTFERNASLTVNLPEATEKPATEKQLSLEVVIDDRGRFYIGGGELVNNRPETVKLALQQLAGGHKDQPLIIRADARTPHQYVVVAMDAAAQLGLVRLSIATTQPQE
jgi:biopolymer transport protein ExbD